MATRTEYARYETIYASAELAAANEVDSMPHLFTNWGCGFAWVAVSGNTAFGRWAKRSKGWKSARNVGMCMGIALYGQNENAKAVYARAFAACLERSGIPASCGSQSD